MSQTQSPTALARQLVIAGKRTEAEAVVAAMIIENFSLSVSKVAINADWSSLNSLNGIVDTDDGRRFFFKFHQEEGEEATVEEYYRAELLQRAGLPVDMPAMICREPGRQILLYDFRRDRQLAAACLAIERSGATGDSDEIVRLQRDLDRLTGDIYVSSLHETTAAQSSSEAIHQLFHNRLVTPPADDHLAGRVERFYQGKAMPLPGADVPWETFAALRWRINGVDYKHTTGELFAESLVRLAPKRLGGHGAVVAHGDAHNANIWIEERDGTSKLVLFDPAFAGEHVPALMADIKATFHNIFAHPLWLYHPAEADERFTVTAAFTDGRISVEHDWALSPIRRRFLEEKVKFIWRPLITTLSERGHLPDDWRRMIRTALFCCPTLVMTLRAGATHGATAGRSPAISALSFAVAVMTGSEPSDSTDIFSEFMDSIAP